MPHFDPKQICEADYSKVRNAAEADGLAMFLLPERVVNRWLEEYLPLGCNV